MSELDDDNNAFDNNDDDNNEDTDQWFNVNFVDDFSNKDKDCERSSFKNKDKDADSKRWSLRRGRQLHHFVVQLFKDKDKDKDADIVPSLRRGRQLRHFVFQSLQR